MASSWVKSILPKFGQPGNGKYETLDDSKDTGSIASLPFATASDSHQAQRQADAATKDAEMVKKAEIERKRKLRRIKKRHENGCACGRCLGVAIRKEENGKK
jgi:hypothetical protein